MLVRSQCKKRQGNLSCWHWRRHRTQSLREGNENEEGNRSEGCDTGRESFRGPSIENEEGGWDKVGRRMTKRTKKDKSKDGPEGSVIEDGQDG